MSTATATDIAWQADLTDVPVTVSAASGLVAVGGADGQVWVINPATAACTPVLELPGGVLRVAVSPAGTHLIATGPTGYALWRREDGRTRVVENGAWSAAAAWAGDRQVAVASGRRAFVLDADGEPLWAAEAAPSTVTDVLWLRDGRRLAVAAYNAVRAHERHSAAPVASYDYLGSHLVLAAASTGKWLCSGNQDASIHIWRLRDGHELTMSGYREKVSRLAFDDTGRWLAADGGPEVTVWDFAGKGPAGTYPRILAAHEAVTALAWRPGGGPSGAAQLATGGREGAIALWEASTGRPGTPSGPARTVPMATPVMALTWAGSSLLIAAERSGAITAHRLPGKGLS